MSAGTRVFLLTLLFLPRSLTGQGFFEQFSYDDLGFSGIGIEAGPVWSDRITTEFSAGFRVDYGLIAPRVRMVFGGTYFKGDLNQSEILRFESNLRGVVIDPTGDALVDVGDITWSNLETTMDLQYLAPIARVVVGYVGFGLGVHLRNGSGAAIDDTFVEDALDTIAAGANLSLGIEVAATDNLLAAIEGRGGLTSELRTLAVRAGIIYRIRPWTVR